jgi:hypothetical protein
MEMRPAGGNRYDGETERHPRLHDRRRRALLLAQSAARRSDPTPAETLGSRVAAR